MGRAKLFKICGGVLSLAICGYVLLGTAQPASASPGHPENRPPANAAENNRWADCSNQGWQALRYGAIWFTNSGNYYSIGVNVSADATTATVYIRGSIFNCHHNGTGNVWAVNVTPTGPNGWRLGGLSTTTLYRGFSQGAHNWSTQGGDIQATLNVSGLAMNNAAGPDTETIYIDLYRCFSTNGSSPTGECLPEPVPVTVTRAQQPIVPLTITCGSTTPITVGVGEPFTLNTTFSTSGGSGPGQARYTIWTHDFTEAGVPQGALAALFGFVARSGGNGSGTIPNGIPGSTMTPVLNTPGVHSGFFRIAVTDASNSPIVCPFTISAVQKPYYRVYGGDVQAGASFGDSCTPTFAAILAQNRGVAPYTGAGSKLATFATNTIFGYASGVGPGGSGWNNPKRLAFANSGSGDSGPGIPAGVAAAPGSTYGGGISRINTICAPDYFAEAPATGALGTDFIVDTAAEGIHRRNGNLTIRGGSGQIGGTADNGNELTIYVQGNAFIETNITYRDSGGYSSINDVPSFRLIVSGNIYVHPNVTELSGLYVAQPRAGVANSGYLYTCGNQAWSGRTPPFVPTATEMASTAVGGCMRNRLRIFGAVAAETIKFLRTPGTANNGSVNERFGASNTSANPGDPAEEIIFTPEAWFGSVNSGDGNYDSVTALPPVL